MHEHIAQLNIGRLLLPLHSPQMAPFVTLLDEVNAIADADPGFVWRMLQADSDSRLFERAPGEQMLVNMSVWRSLESLEAFVYGSAHVAVMKRRREWFARMSDMQMVLWWLPAGRRPMLEDGARRLALLAARGPTAEAFTFRHAFSPSGDDLRVIPRSASHG